MMECNFAPIMMASCRSLVEHALDLGTKGPVGVAIPICDFHLRELSGFSEQPIKKAHFVPPFVGLLSDDRRHDFAPAVLAVKGASMLGTGEALGIEANSPSVNSFVPLGRIDFAPLVKAPAAWLKNHFNDAALCERHLVNRALFVWPGKLLEQIRKKAHLDQRHFCGNEFTAALFATIRIAVVGIDSALCWLKRRTVARSIPLATSTSDLAPFVKARGIGTNDPSLKVAQNHRHLVWLSRRSGLHRFLEQVKESHCFASFLGGFQANFTTGQARS
jgi:hypothetical protein